MGRRDRFFFTSPRRSLRRAAFACALLVPVLAACAAPLPPPDPTARPLPEIRALFAEYPAHLIDALPLACTDPAQRVQHPAEHVIECRSLLPPEGTAGAILRYGGTLERLPESVIRLRTDKTPKGFVIAAAHYLEVPQQAGGVLHVVYPDARLERQLLEVFVRLGGVAL